eukprot:364906-Chlamydomonas_euryale.AAC.15
MPATGGHEAACRGVDALRRMPSASAPADTRPTMGRTLARHMKIASSYGLLRPLWRAFCDHFMTQWAVQHVWRVTRLNPAACTGMMRFGKMFDS